VLVPLMEIDPRFEHSPWFAPTVKALVVEMELNVVSPTVPAETIAELSAVPRVLVFMLIR